MSRRRSLDLAVDKATRDLDRVLSAITDESGELERAVAALQHLIEERRQ